MMASMQPSGMYGAHPKWVEARFAPIILAKANNCWRQPVSIGVHSCKGTVYPIPFPQILNWVCDISTFIYRVVNACYEELSKHGARGRCERQAISEHLYKHHQLNNISSFFRRSEKHTEAACGFGYNLRSFINITNHSASLSSNNSTTTIRSNSRKPFSFLYTANSSPYGTFTHISESD